MRLLSILLLSTFLLSCSSSDSLLKSAGDILGSMSEKPVTQQEAGQGLQAALLKGIQEGAAALSASGGYLNAPEFRIPLPQEAQIVEKRLRDLGLDRQVDRVITSLNHAAEEAAKESVPVFESVIKQLTFADALAIVKGDKNAATEFLKEKTYAELQQRYQSPIKQALDKVEATAYWGEIMTRYNSIPFVDKVNPDLEAYVTEKALDGLFTMVQREEAAIRENPAARTSEILRRVFSLQDSGS